MTGEDILRPLCSPVLQLSRHPAVSERESQSVIPVGTAIAEFPGEIIPGLSGNNFEMFHFDGLLSLFMTVRTLRHFSSEPHLHTYFLWIQTMVGKLLLFPGHENYGTMVFCVYDYMKFTEKVCTTMAFFLRPNRTYLWRIDAAHAGYFIGQRKDLCFSDMLYLCAWAWSIVRMVACCSKFDIPHTLFGLLSACLLFAPAWIWILYPVCLPPEYRLVPLLFVLGGYLVFDRRRAWKVPMSIGKGVSVYTKPRKSFRTCFFSFLPFLDYL